MTHNTESNNRKKSKGFDYKKPDKQINQLVDKFVRLTDNLSDELKKLRYEAKDDAKKIFDSIIKDNEPKTMTYEDAIAYFVEHRPNDPSVQKGAIIRQAQGDGYYIIQTFLNHQNNLVFDPKGVPYGRKVLVERLDEELLELFGEQDLIFVN